MEPTISSLGTVDPIDPGGGGDPHMVTIGGEGFQFVGVPGELYNVFTAHNIAVHCTVKELPDGVQILDRLVVHGPGFDVTIHLDRTEIHTPDHHLVIRQDPGHTEPEGPVRPDPLMGVPHLDFGVRPNVGLEDATGLVVDGHQKPEEDFRLGITWT